MIWINLSSVRVINIAMIMTTPQYERKFFGSGWIDSDNDGQDTRQEVLLEFSTNTVQFADDDQCRIIRGRWISLFTNDIHIDASELDIDHIIPLKWAWDHGAHVWSKDKRIEFANDPANLVVVEASLNRQKGAKGPELWLPPKNQNIYVTRWKRLMIKYNIAASYSTIPILLSQLHSDV